MEELSGKTLSAEQAEFVSSLIGSAGKELTMEEFFEVASESIEKSRGLYVHIMSNASSDDFEFLRKLIADSTSTEKEQLCKSMDEEIFKKSATSTWKRGSLPKSVTKFIDGDK